MFKVPDIYPAHASSPFVRPHSSGVIFSAVFPKNMKCGLQLIHHLLEMRVLAGNQPRCRQGLGDNAHVGRLRALLDQHHDQRRHNDGGHELGQVGQHLEDAAGDVGADFIEEQGQNNRHGETEAQAVEAQDEGVAQRTPELDGEGILSGEEKLEVVEAGEQLLGDRQNIVRHLEAAEQLIHREVSPEKEHQEHGDQHQVETPVLQYGATDMEPVVLFHIIPDNLLRVFDVGAAFLIKYEIIGSFDVHFLSSLKNKKIANFKIDY